LGLAEGAEVGVAGVGGGQPGLLALRWRI